MKHIIILIMIVMIACYPAFAAEQAVGVAYTDGFLPGVVVSYERVAKNTSILLGYKYDTQGIKPLPDKDSVPSVAAHTLMVQGRYGKGLFIGSGLGLLYVKGPLNSVTGVVYGLQAGLALRLKSMVAECSYNWMNVYYSSYRYHEWGTSLEAGLKYAW